jgi:preprotein translocase subunit SecG
MENVILIVHLILALSLIGIVLLQRSEGGGLGMGGGGGGGGVMSGRAAATALGKLTWMFAIGFIVTSMTLTILAAAKMDGTSVVDRITDAPPPIEAPVTSAPLGDGDLLPPPPVGNEPLVPQAAE